jgi:lysozyme
VKLSAAGLRFIAKNEADGGPALKAYLDTGGVWTIGYGHTRGARAGDTCTSEQADAWLLSDVYDAEDSIDRRVHIALNQNQYDALVDFVFNIGDAQFASSTLLKLLNADQPELAALEFRKWRFDNHVEIPGLLLRRIRTKELFETPV